MPFTSLTFLLFFLPLVLAVTSMGGSGRWRIVALITSSLVFYTWGEGPWTLVLLASMALSWGFGMAVGRATPGRSRALWLVAGVAANLSLLVVLKYAAFLAAQLSAVLVALDVAPLPALAPHQPVGISFFTFQGIAYLIGVARGEATAERSPGRAAMLLGLFPGLLAGPIVRARDLQPQLAGSRITVVGLAAGARRFVTGLAKKVLLADVLARAVDGIAAQASSGLAPKVAWFAMIAYTLQIYFDFDGYSDMAIGLARMLGLGYPENFRQPYRATSVADFWSRWHISLSTWFRDYVFLPVTYSVMRLLTPLRLTPRSESLVGYAVGSLITMGLIGLWHGASWTFVVWGLYFAGLLIAERTRTGARLLKVLPVLVRRAYVLLAVALGWVLFRAGSFTATWGFLRAMAGQRFGTPPSTWQFATTEVLLAVVIGALVAVWDSAAWRTLLRRLPPSPAPLRPVLAGASAVTHVVAPILLLVLSLVWLVGATYRPFIYFQF